ncbi:hypothetical protein NPIL_127021 [Nephila pilipes]|uniref:Uncharacterized protein n=1 Tax=Nephila pilipes TaxID=299642 RepID=A0A8X6MPN7_NEPPI|nr:hypothetical protein NPIL_127021 [Nephila pilipes]
MNSSRVIGLSPYSPKVDLQKDNAPEFNSTAVATKSYGPFQEVEKDSRNRSFHVVTNIPRGIDAANFFEFKKRREQEKNPYAAASAANYSMKRLPHYKNQLMKLQSMGRLSIKHGYFETMQRLMVS